VIVALVRLAATGPALSTAGLTVVWTLPPLAVVCVLELCCTFVVAACWVVSPVAAVTAVLGCTAAAVPNWPPVHMRARARQQQAPRTERSRHRVHKEERRVVVGLLAACIQSNVQNLHCKCCQLIQAAATVWPPHLPPALPTQHRALKCKPQHSSRLCALSTCSVMDIHILVEQSGRILAAYSLNLAATNNQCWGCIRVPPLSPVLHVYYPIIIYLNHTLRTGHDMAECTSHNRIHIAIVDSWGRQACHAH